MKNITRSILTAAVALGLAGPAAYSQETTAKEDIKDAGRSTKRAVKKTGSATKKTAKKATNKTAGAVEKGAGKVKDKTE